MPESRGSEQGGGEQGDDVDGGGAVVLHREESQGGGRGIQTVPASKTTMGIPGEQEFITLKNINIFVLCCNYICELNNEFIFWGLEL